MKITIPELIKSAVKAAEFAHAEYSEFPVGAALLTNNDLIYSGCNIESSSFGLTLCAERVALVKALSEGLYDFHSIVIYAQKADFCPPCGACRQLLFDYAPGINVILTDGKQYKSYKLKDLFPVAFEDSRLKK